jgi:hypothetical protein
MADQNQWNQLDHIEKLSWLWDITNGFIENFFEKIGKKRTALFKIEDLFSSVDRVKTLFKFIGAEEISTEQITAIQKSRFNEMVIHPNEPPNMKKTADGVGQVGSPVCGDVMKFWIKVDKKADKIIDCKWQTFWLRISDCFCINDF